MRKTPQEIQADAAIIESHGGIAAIKARLGYTRQRVHNWTLRGIPSDVKLLHPFLRAARKAREAK